MALDVNSLSQNDKIIAGTGIVAFLFSFFAGFGVLNASISSWESGASAKLGALLALAAAAFVLARAASLKLPDLPAGPAFVTLALAGAGTLFWVLRFLDAPGAGGFHLERKWGLFLCLFASIVQTVIALRAFKASGEKAPEIKKTT